MERKNVLIVFAHQSPTSFNAEAKSTALLTFRSLGYSVEVSDLYDMNFKATATDEDIIGMDENSEHFCYAEATRVAQEEGRLAADIVKEQKKLLAADLVIFQFPMYWFSVPAILKGWFDRVLTKGFAYSEEQRYGEGVFKDKKAMLSFSTGGSEELFSPDGDNGDINVTLWPLQYGILHYCGFQVLAPQIFWAPASVPREECVIMLLTWFCRLLGIMNEPPLSLAPVDYFKDGMFKMEADLRQFLAHRRQMRAGV